MRKRRKLENCCRGDEEKREKRQMRKMIARGNEEKCYIKMTGCSKYEKYYI